MPSREKYGMRRLVVGILLVGVCSGLPASAQRYRAPSGNCDAAVMLLEAARVANAKATSELAMATRDKGKVCTAATIKSADERVTTANRLSQRAERLLMACPGMDNAMIQGGKMTELAKTETADAATSRQNLESSCRH
jgi:hypothetical protein